MFSVEKIKKDICFGDASRQFRSRASHSGGGGGGGGGHAPPPHPQIFLNLPSKSPLQENDVINTYISLIKQHWKKMAEILQKRDFLTWSIQNFVRKVKQFVRK